MTLQQLEKRAEDIENQIHALIDDILNETNDLEREMMERKRHLRHEKARPSRKYYTGENRVMTRIIAAVDSLHMAHIIAESHPERFPYICEPRE